MVIDSFTGKYRFLSNFYPCSFIYDYITYRSTEHAYQAAKTDDPSRKKQIIDAKTPGLAKKYGNQLGFFKRKDWDKIKLKIMMDITELKYNGNNELSQMLIDTYPNILIEGNTWKDTFWGVCDGIGCNHLGKILMNRRNQLMGYTL